MTRIDALSLPRWEADERRSADAATDYQREARRRSFDHPHGPTHLDRR